MKEKDPGIAVNGFYQYLPWMIILLGGTIALYSIGKSQQEIQIGLSKIAVQSVLIDRRCIEQYNIDGDFRILLMALSKDTIHTKGDGTDKGSLNAVDLLTKKINLDQVSLGCIKMIKKKQKEAEKH